MKTIAQRGALRDQALADDSKSRATQVAMPLNTALLYMYMQYAINFHQQE
jgi:hypothetical protein